MLFTPLWLQINDAGNVLLDLWVRPKEKVTDFRFHVTGIRWSDLKDGVTPEEASRRVHELTANRILVGHALHNDIKVRLLRHRTLLWMSCFIGAHRTCVLACVRVCTSA
jgi:RNA exonuclease 4